MRSFLGKRRAGELAPEAKPSRKELGRKAGKAGTKTMLAEERKVIATKDSKATADARKRKAKGICGKRKLEISREAKRHELLFPNSKSKSGRKTL